MSTIISATLKQIAPTTSEGKARTHTVRIDRPEAKGGTDRGAMGGELLLVALGGCFMSTLLAAIRSHDAAIQDVHINIAGTLVDSPSRFTDIRLSISADYDDADLMEKLVTISERSCIVANSVRDAINLTFEIEPAQQAV